MQIKRILVPVDFSPPSTLAVNHGAALARQFKATLSLLHVIESHAAWLHTRPGESEKVEAQRKDEADRMLRLLVSSEDRDHLDVKFIVRSGHAENVIQAVANEERADVVVLGTHGRGVFSRLFIGSITQALLRKLGVPVLTVCHVSHQPEFRRILFATDFGPGSDRAFRTAMDFASETGAALTVAHTMDRRPAMTYETPEVHELFDEQRAEDLKQAHERFAGLKEEGARRQMSIACVLEEGDAAETLARIANETEADFIVLGLRNKGAVARALLGSTAEQVIRAAHVPVLSVPIDSKAAAEAA
jgi:nucleotide-binding universal stress UspA family protein